MMKASVLAAATLGASEATRASAGSTQAYEDFRRQFDVHRHDDDETRYQARVALFEQRRDEVTKHNAKPGVTWKAAVNKFADYTSEEFTALLGHRPLRRRVEASTAGASASFLQLKPAAPLAVASAVDWALKLNSSVSKLAKDQGSCGSCWAVAAAGALEAHAEAVSGQAQELSYEQLVDCTPNLRECGGQGGCKGATGELALQYVKQHGIVLKGDYKGYQSGGSGECKQPSQAVLATTGYKQLPVNKMQPLMEALANHGPVVVSADASSWSAYSSGVFNECDKDAVINHAILAMGYGTDKTLGKDYWQIRNSWGPDWGEHGFIRLEKHSEETAYCGTDHKPADGVACKNADGEYPASMPVCGMCGILSDSSYPTGVSMVTN